MIYPASITNYNQTKNQLEEFILFWVCAAWKNGHTAAKCLDKLLSIGGVYTPNYQNHSPFEIIRMIGEDALPIALKAAGIGCYNGKAKTMWQLANSGLNLKTCAVEQLESIYGIGMKTSRCFVIHSRKNCKYAGLDTHVLKFLREKGIKAPLATPSSKKKYKELELIFLSMIPKGKPVAEFDLEIWNKYAIIPNLG